MDHSDFKTVVDRDRITKLDMYLHKGLFWVEHSWVDADSLFEEIAGDWEHFSIEEKIDILQGFTKEYRAALGYSHG